MNLHGARRGGWILLLAVAVASSAFLALAGDKEQEDKEESDSPVVFTKDHPLAEADAGTALLYVVRPTSAGFAVKSFFFVDDDVVGINRGSSYFFTKVAPGKHVFWSKSENVDALELAVEAGKTYYIQQRVRMGGFRARTKLEVLEAAEGEEALADCAKHGEMTSRGREDGKELAVKYKENTKEDLERRAKEKEER